MLTNKDKEDIFGLAKDCLWDKNSLKDIKSKYQLNKGELDLVIREYASEVLKISKYTLLKYKRLYKAFIEFSIETLALYKEAFLYYDKYATKEEKESFKSQVGYILQAIKGNLKVNSNIKDVIALLEIVQKFGLNDKELVNMTFSSFKQYYDFAESVRWKRADIQEEAKKLGILYDKYMALAKGYMKYILKVRDVEEEINSKREKTFLAPECMYDTGIKKLLKAQSDEEIVQIIRDYHIKSFNITDFCYVRNKHLSSIEQVKLEKRLRQIFKRYLELIKTTPVCDEAFYLKFINSGLNVNEFCEIERLHVKTFKRNLVCLQNKELLEEINERIRPKYSKVEISQALIDSLGNLAYLVKNGISEESKVRPFDLIDFYLYFKKPAPYVTFSHNFLDAESRKLIKEFFEPLRYATNFNKEAYLNGVFEVGCLKDEDGLPILGTGRLLSREEVADIISFMESNNIPLNDILFDIAKKRYLTNNLHLARH